MKNKFGDATKRLHLPATQRRDHVLSFIAHFIEGNGYPPTVREICSAMDYRSTSSVFHHLVTLRAAGLLDTVPGRSRAMRITKEGRSYVQSI